MLFFFWVEAESKKKRLNQLNVDILQGYCTNPVTENLVTEVQVNTLGGCRVCTLFYFLIQMTLG